MANIKSVDFLTADGCIDDYIIYQEESHIFGLLLVQTHVALNTLTNRGVFILRIYHVYDEVGFCFFLYSTNCLSRSTCSTGGRWYNSGR
jgi:hypothetical protein